MRVQDLYASGNLEASPSAPASAGKPQPPEPVAPPGERGAAVQGPGAAADRVHLSELTHRLSQTLGSGNPRRAALLERLAAEFQAGRYRVDAAAVSQSLVEEALRGGS
jgi:hypothetical protein